jgi:subtilisin-like proprotein convertase family protein
MANPSGSPIDQDGTLGATIPDDPEFSSQWYLRNTGQNGGAPGADINVLPAWNTVTGKGVTIIVNDTGTDYTNPDIAPNYDAVTSQSVDPPLNDGYPFNPDGAPNIFHGTWTAGLIAAANNDYGIVGVAYDATISAFHLLDTLAVQNDPWGSVATVLANTANFDVANNSWEFTSALADSVFNPDTTIAVEALLTAATTGRGGLGTINVFAAGNSFQGGDDTNLHAFQSSINAVTVAALNDDGNVNAPFGRYSNPGASILVSAPGTDILSDTIVGQGDIADDSGALNFQSGLEGTSFAAPLVSGVVALMLQANPRLGLRDVQEILAYTARQNDPLDPTWQINDAVNWNGGGLHVSNDYGFGLVDAAAAVALAKSWTTQDTANNRTIELVGVQSTGSIAATGSTFSFMVPDSDSLTLNWVRVQLDFTFDTFDNIKVVLTSPGGASSVLLDQPDDGIGASAFDGSVQLSSDQFWGQNSVGTWTVSFSEANPSLGGVGTLYSAGLVLVGDPPPARNTYIYTNEYATAAAIDASRETLTDPGTSGDTLNLAAVTQACTIDLAAGTGGNIGGTPFGIGSGTRVTTVYTGSGDDTIAVNGLADSITSEGGSDTVVFPNARADYTIGGSVGRTMVTLGDVTDTLTNVTTLRFADQSVAVGNLGLIACFAAGTRLRGEDGDVPVEAMCVGNRVSAHFAGTFAPIVWIGRRRVDCSRHPRPNLVRPVRIVTGAFGRHLPNRDLLLSPDHAVFVDGVLIPVKYLINGTTIWQQPVKSITYLHIELPRHDVVLAEGLPVETFLDTCNGSIFADRAGTVALHPDFGSRVWEAEGCAPLVVLGPAVDAVRRRLQRRAVALTGSRAPATWRMLRAV